MEEPSPRRRPPIGVIVALVAVALSAGSATAWFAWRAISPDVPTTEFPELEIDGEVIPEGGTSPSPESITIPELPETDVAVDSTARSQGTIYWISTQGDTVALAPTDIDLPPENSPEDRLTLAFADLMTGPTADNNEAATTIPEQTQLLALTVESDGIHVNLSDSFTLGGGSASMIGRLAQVVYTATTLDPEAPVWISVDGNPLRVLGGEGLLIRQPITRRDLKRDFGVPEPTD